MLLKDKPKIKHKHHIIPRHAGGTDDASNLIELSIEDHAQAHLNLYEQHGRWQDRVAHQMLSGQISVAEAIKDAQRLSNLGNKHFLGKTHTPETKKKISQAQKINMLGNRRALGHKKSDESKKISADKARMYRWITDGNKAKQWLKTEDIPKGYRAGRK